MDESTKDLLKSTAPVIALSLFKIASVLHTNRSMQKMLIQAADIMEKDEHTIKYLLHLLNKHDVELEDFDYIALKDLGIVVKEN